MVEVRQGAGGEETRRGDEERRREERRRRRRRTRRGRRRDEDEDEEEATDIKSNNPHLAGGEKYQREHRGRVQQPKKQPHHRTGPFISGLGEGFSSNQELTRADPAAPAVSYFFAFQTSERSPSPNLKTQKHHNLPSFANGDHHFVGLKPSTCARSGKAPPEAPSVGEPCWTRRPGRVTLGENPLVLSPFSPVSMVAHPTFSFRMALSWHCLKRGYPWVPPNPWVHHGSSSFSLFKLPSQGAYLHCPSQIPGLLGRHGILHTGGRWRSEEVESRSGM